MQIADGTSIPPDGYVVLDTSANDLVLGSAGADVDTLVGPAERAASGYVHRADLPLPGATTLAAWSTSDGQDHFAAEARADLGWPQRRAAATAACNQCLVGESKRRRPVAGSHEHDRCKRHSCTIRTTCSRAGCFPAPLIQLPAGIELPPGGRMLVTSADPSDLCLSGRVPAGLRVVGPLTPAAGRPRHGLDTAPADKLGCRLDL